MSAALHIGSKGSDVRKLQQDLNAKLPSVSLKVDGDFGPKTKAAVEQFQKYCKLKVDGIAGGKTLSTLLPAGSTTGSEPRHVLGRGETLASLCRKHNNCDPKVIWEHPTNKSLRTARLRPELILPGDTVVFPPELTAPPVEYYEFKYNGKTMQLTKDDYNRAVAETAKKLSRLADVLYQHHQFMEGMVREMLASASGANGMLEAFVAFTSAKWAGVDIPEFASQSKSYSAVLAARNVCKRNDLGASRKALNDAQMALRSFERDVSKYRDKIIGGASSITSKLELTRDASFAVAEVLATAIITAKTLNPKAAATSSAIVFGAIKSGATEVGEHLADPKRTWNQSAKNIVVDTAVSGVASKIAGSVKPEFVKKWAAKATAKAMTDKTIKILGKEVTQEAAEKFLTAGGQKVLEDGMNEIVKAGGEMAKKGRILTSKEVSDQISEYATGLVVGSFVKKMKGATWKFSRNMEATLVDSQAMKLGSWYAGLGKAQRAKVMHDIFTKNQEAIIKHGMADLGSWYSPDMTEDAIVKKAEKAALSNKKLMDMVAKEVEKLHKKGGKV